ncbi:MAG: hypothetical protein HY225_03745 [Candidatus Vogelbacteria bacterium]|nr:hypothetical protein [Candidatus Vogelbacteria bacterium]
MFHITEDKSNKLVIVMAFRGSGKSTIMNTSNTLWSILSKRKKFVVIASKTKRQARSHFENILNELEYNELLKSDFGPFNISPEEGSSYSIVIPSVGAKIMTIASGVGMRGIRYGSHRPDLIICDDIEDMSFVQTEKSRDLAQQWFITEIMPAGDGNTQIVVLGNLLHKESLLMKLKKDIEDSKLSGIFRAYPIVDDSGKILWPERYSEEDIDKLKKQIGDEQTWGREYLLHQPPKSTRFFYYYGQNDPLYQLAKRQHLEGKRSGKNKRLIDTHLTGYRISVPIVEDEYAIKSVMCDLQTDKQTPFDFEEGL